MNEELMLNTFYKKIVPFGYLDVKRAIEVCSLVNLNEDDLCDIIKNYMDDGNYKMEEIDIVYILYEHILQEVRQIISYNFGFDILDTVYTYGNYLCTMYDNTDKIVQMLENKIKKMNKRDKKIFLENPRLIWFLGEIGVEYG